MGAENSSHIPHEDLLQVPEHTGLSGHDVTSEKIVKTDLSNPRHKEEWEIRPFGLVMEREDEMRSFGDYYGRYKTIYTLCHDDRDIPPSVTISFEAIKSEGKQGTDGTIATVSYRNNSDLANVTFGKSIVDSVGVPFETVALLQRTNDTTFYLSALTSTGNDQAPLIQTVNTNEQYTEVTAASMQYGISWDIADDCLFASIQEKKTGRGKYIVAPLSIDTKTLGTLAYEGYAEDKPEITLTTLQQSVNQLAKVSFVFNQKLNPVQEDVSVVKEDSFVEETFNL